jgi:hypothetical protein
VNNAIGIVSHTGRAQRALGRLGKASKRLARPSPLIVALLAALPALLWAKLTPTASLLLFMAGVVIFFVLPGLALARLLRLRCAGEELLPLVLGMGLASSNLLFAATARAQASWLYWLLPTSSAGYLAWRYRARRRAAQPLEVGVAATVLLLPIVGLACAGLLLMPVHALDFTLEPGRGMHLVAPPDGTLHTAIAAEVARNVPPINPFLGDQRLVYHYSTELTAAVFCKFLALPPASVSLRLLPTLYVALAVLAVFAFVKRLTGSRAVALVTPLLVLLGEDFSYFPGLWKGSSGGWAGEYFSSPSVFGLYFVNPNLPAVAAFFCALIASTHAYRGGRVRAPWLVVAAALLALAGAYKIFFGMQTLGALALATLLCGSERRRFFLALAPATGLGLLALFAPMLVWGSEAKIIELVPTLYTGFIPTALASLGLSDLPWFSSVLPMFSAKQLSFDGAMQLFGLAVPLFVVGTLGIKLVGLPALLRSLRPRASVPPTLLFLALFVGLGYVLGLGLRVTPIDYPDSYNNSVWFLVESKLVSSVFVALMLGNVFRSWSPAAAAWTALLQVVVLAAPGTVNTFKAGSQNGDLMLAATEEVAVAEYFRRSAPSGAIVACDSPSLRRVLLGIAGVRVPFSPEFFPVSFLRRAQIEARTSDLAAFWQAWSEGHFRTDLAQKYQIDFVVSQRQLAGQVELLRQGTWFVYSWGASSRAGSAPPRPRSSTAPFAGP